MRATVPFRPGTGRSEGGAGPPVVSTMHEEPLTILLVEDSPADARLIRETLVEDGVTHLDLEHVQLVAEAIERLRQGGIDAVLLDLFLPDNMGPDTVQKVIQVSPHTPVVVLTGVADKEAALASVRHGAQDYLVKGQITADVLVRTIHYAVERKRFEAALARSPMRPSIDREPPAPPERHAEPDRRPSQDEADADDEGGATAATSAARDPEAPDGPRDRLARLGDDAFVRELRRAPLPDARARGLTRVLDDFLELAGHEPRPGPCDTARAFDHALARLQDRILEDEMHVRRYPLPPVFADEVLLSHLFEATLAAGLALGGQRDLSVQLSCERDGGAMRFTLVTGPAEGGGSAPGPRPGRTRGGEGAVAAMDYPEVALARRLAERMGGSLEAAAGPSPGVHALRFALPTLDASLAAGRGSEGAASSEEK